MKILVKRQERNEPEFVEIEREDYSDSPILAVAEIRTKLFDRWRYTVLVFIEEGYFERYVRFAIVEKNGGIWTYRVPDDERDPPKIPLGPDLAELPRWRRRC